MCPSHDAVAGQGSYMVPKGRMCCVLPWLSSEKPSTPHLLSFLFLNQRLWIFNRTSSSWANQYTKSRRPSAKTALTNIPFTLWSTRSAA